MKKARVLIWIMWGAALSAFLIPEPVGWSADPAPQITGKERQDSDVLTEHRGILAEIFLPRDQKSDEPQIQKELNAISITRVRMQFFYPAGVSLQNIAIGSEIPADVARFAIHLAKKYNKGVRLLVHQFRFPPHYVAIGTSAFDELAQIPISPQDLERLSDPSLTTSQFHILYRQLTGEGDAVPN